MENKNTENDATFNDDEKLFQDFEFESLDDFTDNGAFNIGNNEVSTINVEEYAFQELDLDARYRSIQAVNPHYYSEYSVPSLNSMAPPSLSKGSSHVDNFGLSSKAPLPVVVKPSTRPVVVPEQPFHVAVTHFTTSLDIDSVICCIEQELKSILEVSYEFSYDKCKWDCVYLCGSTRCKFELSVFKNGLGSYLIEGNRLSGDSFPFSNIYRRVRSKLSGEPPSPSSVTDFQFIPLPDSVLELSSSEIFDAVTPILTMAGSGKYESQVNAAQMFCDLSMQQNMVEVLCEARCVKALVSLCDVEFDYCNQHAICALANLSSSRSCQDVLLEHDYFLQNLIQMCCCGNYNTAEMRRECARLLANLCSVKSSAKKVFHSVGEDDIRRWMDSVDDLHDERLRLHANRAKQSLCHV